MRPVLELDDIRDTDWYKAGVVAVAEYVEKVFQSTASDKVKWLELCKVFPEYSRIMDSLIDSNEWLYRAGTFPEKVIRVSDEERARIAARRERMSQEALSNTVVYRRAA